MMRASDLAKLTDEELINLASRQIERARSLNILEDLTNKGYSELASEKAGQKDMAELVKSAWHDDVVAAIKEAEVKEVRVTDPVTGGQKGQKDCQIGAVDPKALWEVGRVAGFGGDKYERYNFAKGYKWSLSYDALQRHLMQFWAGEDRDNESGLYHIAHAAWHCLALLTFLIRQRGTDDRFPISQSGPQPSDTTR